MRLVGCTIQHQSYRTPLLIHYSVQTSIGHPTNSLSPTNKTTHPARPRPLHRPSRSSCPYALFTLGVRVTHSVTGHPLAAALPLIPADIIDRLGPSLCHVRYCRINNRCRSDIDVTRRLFSCSSVALIRDSLVVPDGRCRP